MCSGDEGSGNDGGYNLFRKRAVVAINLLLAYSVYFIFGLNLNLKGNAAILSVVLGPFAGVYGTILGCLIGNQILRPLLKKPTFKGENNPLPYLILFSCFTIPFCASSAGLICLDNGMQLVQRLNWFFKINAIMFSTLYAFTVQGYL
jgi:hypothetical protein